MAIRLHYFDYFPTVDYDVDKSGVDITATNIMHRFKLLDILRTKAVLFHTYNIGMSERPDHVAAKFYGRPKLDWLILLTNEIMDPHFEWYMNHWQFEEYVSKKYGSVEDAHQTNHHYELIVDQEEETLSGRIIPERTIIIDKTEYNSTPDEDRKAISMYEYEKVLNEARREIKILNETYIPALLREAENIIK